MSARVNATVARFGTVFPSHKCDKATYEHVYIYRDPVYDPRYDWILEVDGQSALSIMYCPFCGEKLL